MATTTVLSLRASAELERRRRVSAGLSERTPPEYWQDWLRVLFPKLFCQPFADHHVDFWEWVEAITLDNKPVPFFAVWARGGAKSTNAEAAVVRVGAKGVRKFCLYVRATQDKANESVTNIAAMLESEALAKCYPRLSERKLSKYGFARGWRVDTLRCGTGFSVIGLGFDAAIRGVKIEEARPDFIVLDDIDDMRDSLRIVNKKIEILTTTILPAGSANVAVLGVQNLMHANSIFNQVVEGTADFLHGRIVSGPYPAVSQLEYEALPGGGYRITGGQATWQGQPLAVCQQQLNEWGLTAFLREAQHDVVQRGGVWQHVNFVNCDWDEVPAIVKGAVWVDPAVTSTDESDAFGIQAGGLGVDGRLYCMFSWEQVTSPEDALARAILKCLELGFTAVGVETDQGGDLWRSAYVGVWEQLVAQGRVAAGARMPTFKAAKAGAGHGSKAARNQRMLADYERGKIVHVRGTHQVLERALRRFPTKPLDLADVAYWLWWDLMGGMTGKAKVGTLKSRRDEVNAAYVNSRHVEAVATLRYKGKRNFSFPVGQRRWYISPGWQRAVNAELAQRIVSKFPEHFEVVDSEAT